MASFGRQFSTASPVLTMPPQPAHQAPFGMAGFAHQQASAPAPAPAPPPPFGAMPVSNPPMAPLQKSVPSGRKRSRDEAATNLEPDIPAPSPQESEEDWVYGEGMVLIKASKGYVADASSQSGTWLEEKKTAEDDNRRKIELETEQLMPRNNKLQRLDGGIHGESPAPAPAASSVAVNAPSPSVTSDKGPVIDDFTLHLGIGWRKVSEDEHIQAAARGWARFIENHYPLTNAQIRLESNGLQSYLVESSEGFFLFAENLRRGRLVSTNVEGALRNLQMSPPAFDGPNELVAAESPSALEPQREVPPVDTEMNMD